MDDAEPHSEKLRFDRDEFYLQNCSADEIYRRWFPLYRELSTLPIDSEAVRHSPKTIAHLRALGWNTSPQTFDAYWHRVHWISSRCEGRVLEIGCGMGNVTRWIAANPAVESVLALDVLETYIAVLNGLSLPKVTALCYDISWGGAKIAPYGPFDTIVLSELIEHMSFDQEMTIVNTVRPHLSSRATWVISTPIGFMPDPDHKRGFSRFSFRWHTRLIYGQILSGTDNSLQQYVACKESRPQSASIWQTRTMLGGVLDHLFVVKPIAACHMFQSLSVCYRRVCASLRRP